MEESRQPQKIVTFKVSPEKFASILNKPPNPSFHRNAPRTTRIASPKASSANLASIISNNSKRPHDSQPHEPPRKVTVLSVSPARLASITNTPPPRPDALPSSLTPYLAPLGRTIRDTREGARARAQAISARERFGGTRHMLEIYQRHADPDDPDDPWSQYLFDQDYTYSYSDSNSNRDRKPIHRNEQQAQPLFLFLSISISISVFEILMAEISNQKQPAAEANGEGGLPYYEAQRKHLQKLMEKRRKIAERLIQREERIEQKETEYLETTPAGNILTGFDNYTKGTTQAAAAQRRKVGSLDQHRVFSRSSISYNPNNSASDSATTPGSSHAPTPVSTTFGGSNHPTPTSAGGSRPSGGAPRDRKKKAVAGATDAGDSESDAKEVKKVRANFGASRK